MPQLHFYVPDEVAKAVRERARSHGVPVSRYLASMVRQELGGDWPAGFFEQVVGGWQGAPLRRPRQGRLEQRDAL